MTDLQHIVCPSCLSVNRVPGARLSDDPVCGKCRRELFDGQPLELTSSTFDRHLTRNDIPMVVDFWASWCGPCKMMAPAYAQAAQDMAPSIRFAKVDTEAAAELAARFGIRSIPTMILFRDGHEVARRSGAAGKNDIEKWIKSQL